MCRHCVRKPRVNFSVKSFLSNVKPQCLKGGVTVAEELGRSAISWKRIYRKDEAKYTKGKEDRTEREEAGAEAALETTPFSGRGHRAARVRERNQGQIARRARGL